MRLDPNAIMKRLKALNLDAYKTASELKIHVSTVYRWRRRARTYRNILRHTGLRRKSTKPKHLKYIIAPEDQIKIIKLRKDRGLCAQRIRAEFKQYSYSTIFRYLKRRGYVKGRKKYWRPLLQDTNHMHARNTTTIGKLQMDVKHVMPYLSGLKYTVFEYAIVDIYSRFKQAVILPELNADSAMFALQVVLPTLPFKTDFVQTDNGLEFQSRFAKFLEENKIKHYYIHKSSPNENAVIERSFRTDEEEFYSRRTKNFETLEELNQAYQEYLKYYNTERYHLGINLKTPIQVVAEVMNH